MIGLLQPFFEKLKNAEKEKNIVPVHLRRLRDITFIAYCLSVMGVLYGAYYFGIDSSNCDWCNQLANQFSPIDRLTAYTIYPQPYRVAVIYSVLTTPLVVIFLIWRIRSIRKGSIPFRFFAFFLLILTFMIFTLYLVPADPKATLEEPNATSLFRNSFILGCTATGIVSLSFYCLMAIFSFFRR